MSSRSPGVFTAGAAQTGRHQPQNDRKALLDFQLNTQRAPVWSEIMDAVPSTSATWLQTLPDKRMNSLVGKKTAVSLPPLPHLDVALFVFLP